MVLHQFSLLQILVVAVIVIVSLAAIQHWALSRLNADPGDEDDDALADKDAEILGDAPVRSKVGTPRPRRLQPVRGLEESTLASARSMGGDLVPGDSLAMAGPSAFAKPAEASRPDQPIPFGAEGSPQSPFAPKMPPLDRPDPAAETLSPSKLKVDGPALPEPILPPITSVTPLPNEKLREPIAMPPLTTGAPASADVPEPAPKERSSLSAFAAKLFGSREPDPVASVPATAPVTEESAVAPLVEKVAEGLVAVGAPVSLASTPAASEVVDETDDVKKRKYPQKQSGSEPARGGIFLAPKDDKAAADAVRATEESKPVEPLSITPPVPAVEDAAITVVPPSEPAAEPSKTGRSRVFLPTNLASAAVKPANESAAVAPTPVESKGPDVVTPAPDKDTPSVSPPAEAKIEPTPEVKVEPISEGKAEAASEIKTEPEPEAKAEPALEAKPESALEASPIDVDPTPDKPETAPQSWLNRALGMFSEPTAAKPDSAEPEASAAKVEEEPPTPAPALVEAVAPVEVAAPISTAAPQTSLIEQKAGPETAAAAESSPVPPPPVAPAEPVISESPRREISVPTPIMAQTESTTTVPANSRASAQLTLGFEITSLQLTPFFKLGAVQLKPLSKIVGLHLIATQSADNPLAAGISFEIDHVELNEASQLKSILLKPMQNNEPSAVPQPKLQIDAIQIGQGGEGAPISVTTAGASAVQLLATFTIAAMNFTPAFEIGSLRLEPTSNSVLLRLAASSRPAALDLPPSFEVASIQLGSDAQIAGLRLTPGSKPV